MASIYSSELRHYMDRVCRSTSAMIAVLTRLNEALNKFNDKNELGNVIAQIQALKPAIEKMPPGAFRAELEYLRDALKSVIQRQVETL